MCRRVSAGPHLTYARRLAAEKNAITYVHHPELTHGFIKFTERSARCREATEELADLLGELLATR